MLKLAGIICIFAGCAGWGVSKIGEEQYRVRQLRELIRIMKRIQNEISYGKHTLPEICFIMSEYSDAPYSLCFAKIYEQADLRNGVCLTQIWQQQMMQCMRDIPLIQEEKSILIDLPRNLGGSEETHQAECIGQSLDLLVRRCRLAEDSYAGKAKMIFSISLLAGVFMMILLL